MIRDVMRAKRMTGLHHQASTGGNDKGLRVQKTPAKKRTRSHHRARTGGNDKEVRVQKEGMTCFGCRKKRHNLRECMKIPNKDKNAIFTKNTEDWKRADGSDYRTSPKKGVVSVEASLHELRHKFAGIEAADPSYYDKVMETEVP